MATSRKPPHSLLDRLFRDRLGRFIIFQIPNPPIILAGLAWLAMLIVHSGPWYFVLEIIFNLSLVVWAVLEIGWGATKFRRLLGAFVLGWISVSLLVRIIC